MSLLCAVAILILGIVALTLSRQIQHEVGGGTPQTMVGTFVGTVAVCMSASALGYAFAF